MLDVSKPKFSGDLAKLADALRKVADDAKSWNAARDAQINEDLVPALCEVVSGHLSEVRAEWRGEVKAVLTRHLLDACTSMGISLAQRAWLGFLDLGSLRDALDPHDASLAAWQVQLLQDSRPVPALGSGAASAEETASDLRARFDGPVDARLLGFEAHADGVDLEFEPSPQVESVRVPAFLVADKAWGQAVGNGPPVTVATLEQGGKQIGADITGTQRGRAAYCQSEARISWWLEGNPNLGAPTEFSWHEPRKDRCFVYGADLWLQTRHVGRNGTPIRLKLRFPGMQAFRAFPAIIRTTLSDVVAAKLEHLRGPDAARPSRWRIECGDRVDGVTPTAVALTPPRAEMSSLADAPELRMLLRTAARRRGICTRLDLADAVNEFLGRSDLAMKYGLRATPETVSGHTDFNAMNRQVNIVWRAIVRPTKGKLTAVQQGEARNLLGEIQVRLEPHVPPGTCLQLTLDGAHGVD